jgi:hypothetical protein
MSSVGSARRGGMNAWHYRQQLPGQRLTYALGFGTALSDAYDQLRLGERASDGTPQQLVHLTRAKRWFCMMQRYTYGVAVGHDRMERRLEILPRRDALAFPVDGKMLSMSQPVNAVAESGSLTTTVAQLPQGRA